MSDPLFDGDDKANTPLTPQEHAGLIPSYITLRRELNEVEQINIEKGDRWAFARRARHDVLDEDFLHELHKRMYGDVWKWAGQFRTTPRNIGVEAWNIAPNLRVLLDDVVSGSSTAPIRPMKSPCVFIIVWCSFIRFRTAMAVSRVWLRICWQCGLASLA